MKSIEERAYKKSLEMFKPKANVTTKELLIEMATEQEQIDKQEFTNKLKKACEKVESKHLHTMGFLFGWITEAMLEE